MSISVGIDVVSDLVGAAGHRPTSLRVNVSQSPPRRGGDGCPRHGRWQGWAREVRRAPSAVLGSVRGSCSQYYAMIPFSGTTS